MNLEKCIECSKELRYKNTFSYNGNNYANCCNIRYSKDVYQIFMDSFSSYAKYSVVYKEKEDRTFLYGSGGDRLIDIIYSFDGIKYLTKNEIIELAANLIFK